MAAISAQAVAAGRGGAGRGRERPQLRTKAVVGAAVASAVAESAWRGLDRLMAHDEKCGIVREAMAQRVKYRVSKTKLPVPLTACGVHLATEEVSSRRVIG